MAHSHTCVLSITSLTAAPTLPEGEELNVSSTRRSAGIFSHLPSPDLGSIQVSSEDTEETNRETDDSPLTFQTNNESAGEEACPPSPEVKINVIDEDEEEGETEPLIRRTDGKGVWHIRSIVVPCLVVSVYCMLCDSQIVMET